MVTLPYVQGVTEPVERILKHHDITSAVRHENLSEILVHPKQKVEDKHNTDCVYQIPCKTCNMFTSVKQEEHLVPDLKNIKKKWKQ